MDKFQIGHPIRMLKQKKNYKIKVSKYLIYPPPDLIAWNWPRAKVQMDTK